MARIVISISFGSSQPRFSAPFVMTSLEHPAANFLSLNFFFKLDTSISFALFEGLIDMEKGYIRTDEDMRTSLPGVLAGGDVRAKRYRQITTAMGDGTVAALEAERFIRSLR